MPEEQIISNAALPDSRPDSAKEKDYLASEVATASLPTFQNPKIIALTATVYDQWYVGDCVPHGFLTQLEYEGLASGISQLRMYRKRSNYPNAGSIGVDIYDKIRMGQSTDLPTPVSCTESQANALPLIVGEKLIKDFNYFQHINTEGHIDFSIIPQDVASGKAVAIFIFATDDEWSREYVEIQNPNLTLSEATIRHCVCLVPKGDFTENGKQWLTIHDSAKFGGRHLRYMPAEFLGKRVYFSAKVYPKDTPSPAPPVSDKPLVPCAFNDTSDAVRTLQRFMWSEGKLKEQYITGFYGALTSKAVLWWQLEHWEKFTGGVPQLLEYGGKYWGKQSIDIIS